MGLEKQNAAPASGTALRDSFSVCGYCTLRARILLGFLQTFSQPLQLTLQPASQDSARAPITCVDLELAITPPAAVTETIPQDHEVGPGFCRDGDSNGDGSRTRRDHCGEGAGPGWDSASPRRARCR